MLAAVAGLIQLGQVTHPAVPLGAVLTGAVVLAVWPPACRAVRDRCFAVVVQHRLRTVFHELGLTTWAGRAPAIV